jgi:hypothetical protein
MVKLRNKRILMAKAGNFFFKIITSLKAGAYFKREYQPKGGDQV